MGKKEFTEKRRPYKSYKLAKWIWKDIFFEIDELKKKMNYGYLKLISEKYGIVLKTLCNKYYKYIEDKSKKINDNRGGKNKIFTNKEELDIFNLLKEKFIDKQIALCNEDIKIIALNKYKELHKDDNFTASNGWCNGFKKRWNLITVKIKISKVSTKIHTKDELEQFMNECRLNYDLVGSNFFLI